MTETSVTQRREELVLSEDEFDRLRKIIREHTGISMSSSKRQLVYRRLSKRLRQLNFPSFHAYSDYLASGDKAELEEFCNAVTTNLTSFFREAHHFEFLANNIVPDLVAKHRHTDKRLRIWSAGSSTGEEPYSIAITLRESMPDLRRWDARILATDLDSNVLATGATGIYSYDRVEKMEESRLKRWFIRDRGKAEPDVRVRPELQELIAFRQLNLMHDWPMKGKFDVIFCRNVIIYFDKATQRTLIDRYAEHLHDGGYLILGHSESLLNVSDRFTLLGQTIYRKQF